MASSSWDVFDTMMAPFNDDEEPPPNAKSSPELPPSVGSQETAALQMVESEVELPEAVALGASCCRNQCCKSFLEDSRARDAKVRLQHELDQAAPDARAALHFNLMLEMVRHQLVGQGERRKTFWFHGRRLCQKAWCEVTGCSVKLLKKVLQSSSDGPCATPGGRA